MSTFDNIRELFSTFFYYKYKNTKRGVFSSSLYFGLVNAVNIINIAAIIRLNIPMLSKFWIIVIMYNINIIIPKQLFCVINIAAAILSMQSIININQLWWTITPMLIRYLLLVNQAILHNIQTSVRAIEFRIRISFLYYVIELLLLYQIIDINSTLCKVELMFLFFS